MFKKIVSPLLFIITSTIIICGFLLFGVSADNTGETVFKNPSESEKQKFDFVSLKENDNYREALPHKNETVYAVLDHYGNIEDQRIVNRIYDSEDTDTEIIKDFGNYLSVNNLTSEHKPELTEDSVLWDNRLLKENDIYYEGITNKELPVDFNITYYLNGRETDAAELAGKSGHLKIVISMRNNLKTEEPVSYTAKSGEKRQQEDVNYVPMLVQGTYSADLQKFSDISAEDAAGVIIGQSMDINFMAFPYPEEEIVISMQGEDIELENIMIMIIPQLPPIPEIDMEDDLTEMLDGVSEISDGLVQLYSGMDEMLEGMELFRDKVAGMMDDFDMEENYQDDFEALRNLIKELEDEITPDTIDEMIEQTENLLALLEQMPDTGTFNDNLFDALMQQEQLISNSDGTAANNSDSSLNREIDNLSEINREVAAEARKLIEENEEGSRLHELGILLLNQEEQVSRISSENTSADEENEAPEFDPEDFVEEVIPEEWQQLEENADSITGELEDLLEYLILLRDMLIEMEDPVGELTALIDSAEEMLEQAAILPQALEEMVEGQKQIRDGTGELHEKGILEMEKGLIEGINEMRFANAKTDKMKELAEDYRSFANNEKNRNSTVQFILQTSKLEAEKTEEETHTEDKNEGENGFFRNLWERFIALFDL